MSAVNSVNLYKSVRAITATTIIVNSRGVVAPTTLDNSSTTVRQHVVELLSKCCRAATTVQQHVVELLSNCCRAATTCCRTVVELLSNVVGETPLDFSNNTRQHVVERLSKCCQMLLEKSRWISPTTLDTSSTTVQQHVAATLLLSCFGHDVSHAFKHKTNNTNNFVMSSIAIDRCMRIYVAHVVANDRCVHV